MKQTLSIAFIVCLTMLHASCFWSKESSFYSNFSMQQLVERSKSSAGLTCDAIGGGGGGSSIGTRAGGLGLVGAAAIDRDDLGPDAAAGLDRDQPCGARSLGLGREQRLEDIAHEKSPLTRALQ